MPRPRQRDDIFRRQRLADEGLAALNLVALRRMILRTYLKITGRCRRAIKVE